MLNTLPPDKAAAGKPIETSPHERKKGRNPTTRKNKITLKILFTYFLPSGNITKQ
jgi:hypothetical protein